MRKIQRFLPALFILLVVIGAMLIYQNDLVKYSDFESSIKVELTGIADYEQIYASLSENPNLIEIDRVNNVVYYQKVGQSEIQTEVSSKLEEFSGVTAVYSQTYFSISKLEAFSKTWLSFVLIALVFLGSTYVLKTRFYRWSLKTYLVIYSVLTIIFAGTAVLLTGLISAVSLIYKVGYLELFSFYFTVFILALLVWQNLSDKTLEELKSDVLLKLNNQVFKLLQITLPIVVLLAFGLGPKIVIPVVIIIVSLVLIYLAYYAIFTTLQFLNLKPNISLPKVSLPSRKPKLVKPAKTKKAKKSNKSKNRKK